MKRIPGSALAILALVTVVVGGCGEDTEVGPQPAQLKGDWIATKAELVSQAPAGRVDLLANGATLTLRIGSDQRWVYVHTPPGGPPDTTFATWQLDGDEIRVSPDATPGVTWVWSVNLSGTTLSLTNAEILYDIDENGSLDQVRHNMTLVR